MPLHNTGSYGFCHLKNITLAKQANLTIMTPAAKSVYFFGFYLLGLALILIVIPNFLLSLFQMPSTNEVWIRVVGALAGGIGTYYVQMAPTNNTQFLSATIGVRLSILVWFTLFVLAGWAPAALIIFGLADAAGAAWTFLSMKKS